MQPKGPKESHVGLTRASCPSRAGKNALFSEAHLGSKRSLPAVAEADNLGAMSTATDESEEPKFRAHLVDEATIVDRGERVKVWFIPWQSTWIRAKDHPDATVDEVSSDARANRCPPGTVWQRSIELSLLPRTPLLCRITRPLLESLGTVDYMTKDRRSVRRQVDELWYVLVGNYKLKRHREPDSFTAARKEHERRMKARG